RGRRGTALGPRRAPPPSRRRRPRRRAGARFERATARPVASRNRAARATGEARKRAPASMDGRARGRTCGETSRNREAGAEGGGLRVYWFALRRIDPLTVSHFKTSAPPL